MVTPDANIILYAYNEDAPKHYEAKKWLEEQFSSADVFGLSWQVITAFLRISTNPRAFPNPFDLKEVTEIVDEWLELPNIKILTPTANHWTIFQKLINEGQTKAALMMDAHLAALAIEHEVENISRQTVPEMPDRIIAATALHLNLQRSQNSSLTKYI